MKIKILRVLTILLAVFNFGYMVMDGIIALTQGDYIRPESGEYAGQLGPWSKLVSAIGIPPESIFMKCFFVFFGILGLLITIAFIRNKKWSLKAMIVINFLSLWYLWFGTMSSAMQIMMLSLLHIHQKKR